MDQEYLRATKELREFIALNDEDQWGRDEYLAISNLLILTNIKMEKEQEAEKSATTSAKLFRGSRGASVTGKLSNNKQKKTKTNDGLDTIANMLNKLTLIRKRLETDAKKGIRSNSIENTAKQCSSSNENPVFTRYAKGDILDNTRPESEGNSVMETITPKRISTRSISFERTPGIVNRNKYVTETDTIFDTPPVQTSTFEKSLYLRYAKDDTLDNNSPESAKVFSLEKSATKEIEQDMPKRILTRSISFDRTRKATDYKTNYGLGNETESKQSAILNTETETTSTAVKSWFKRLLDWNQPKDKDITLTKWKCDGDENSTPTTVQSNKNSSTPSPIRSSPISPPDNRSIQEPKPTKDVRSKIKPPSRSSSIPKPSRNYSFSMHDKSNSQSPRSSIERASTSSNSSRTSSIPQPTQYKLSLLHEQSKSDNPKKITDQTLISNATKRSSSIPTPVRRNIFGPQDKSEDPKSKTERISRPSVAKKSTSNPGENRRHSASP